jgi:cyclophilin family peptidyl-prolyl cis-trans isomerase
MRLLALLALLVIPFALVACGGDEKSAEDTTTEATTTSASSGGCETKERPAPKDVGNLSAPTDSLDASKTYTITFKTSCGDFTVKLDVEKAPKTSASVYALAKDGFYDETFFHRIVPGFVIQGGDPAGDGSGGPGYTVQDNVPQDAAYTHGVVAMAKTAVEPAGTSGSQFFVVTGQDVGLPPDYAILGTVTEGIDVVDRIGKLGDASEQPTKIVVIESAEVSPAD